LVLTLSFVGVYCDTSAQWFPFDLDEERSARVPRDENNAKNSPGIANAPNFQQISNDLPKLTETDKESLAKATSFTNTLLERLGLVGPAGGNTEQREVRRQPPTPLYQTDADLNAVLAEASQNRVDLQGVASGQIPGLAPIPCRGLPDHRRFPPSPE